MGNIWKTWLQSLSSKWRVRKSSSSRSEYSKSVPLLILMFSLQWCVEVSTTSHASQVVPVNINLEPWRSSLPQPSQFVTTTNYLNCQGSGLEACKRANEPGQHQHSKIKRSAPPSTIGRHGGTAGFVQDSSADMDTSVGDDGMMSNEDTVSVSGGGKPRKSVSLGSLRLFKYVTEKDTLGTTNSSAKWNNSLPTDPKSTSVNDRSLIPNSFFATQRRGVGVGSDKNASSSVSNSSLLPNESENSSSILKPNKDLQVTTVQSNDVDMINGTFSERPRRSPFRQRMQQGRLPVNRAGPIPPPGGPIPLPLPIPAPYKSEYPGDFFEFPPSFAELNPPDSSFHNFRFKRPQRDRTQSSRRSQQRRTGQHRPSSHRLGQSVPISSPGSRNRYDRDSKPKRPRNPSALSPDKVQYSYPKHAENIQDILKYFDRENDVESPIVRKKPSFSPGHDLSNELKDVQSSLLKDIREFARRPTLMGSHEYSPPVRDGFDEMFDPKPKPVREMIKNYHGSGSRDRDRDSGRYSGGATYSSHGGSHGGSSSSHGSSNSHGHRDKKRDHYSSRPQSSSKSKSSYGNNHHNKGNHYNKYPSSYSYMSDGSKERQKDYYSTLVSRPYSGSGEKSYSSSLVPKREKHYSSHEERYKDKGSSSPSFPTRYSTISEDDSREKLGYKEHEYGNYRAKDSSGESTFARHRTVPSYKEHHSGSHSSYASSPGGTTRPILIKRPFEGYRPVENIGHHSVETKKRHENDYHWSWNAGTPPISKERYGNGGSSFSSRSTTANPVAKSSALLPYGPSGYGKPYTTSHDSPEEDIVEIHTGNGHTAHYQDLEHVDPEKQKEIQLQKMYLEFLQQKLQQSESSLGGGAVSSSSNGGIAVKPKKTPMRMKIHIYPNENGGSETGPGQGNTNPYGPHHTYLGGSGYLSASNPPSILSVPPRNKQPQHMSAASGSNYNSPNYMPVGPTVTFNGAPVPYGHGTVVVSPPGPVPPSPPGYGDHNHNIGHVTTASPNPENDKSKNVVLHLHVHRRNDPRSSPLELDAEASEQNPSTVKPLTFKEIFDQQQQENEDQEQHNDKSMSMEVPIHDDKIDDVLHTLLKLREKSEHSHSQ